MGERAALRPVPKASLRMQSTPSTAHTNRRAWWLWGGLLVVAFALRWPLMGESLWIDELYTSRLFCGPPLVLMKTLFSDIHPPVYFLFMHGWIAAFGDSELALRTPPLIAGLLSLVVVRQLGARWFGSRVGWIAAWGLALSPTHLWYSTEARPYSANLLLTLLCVWAYAHLRDRQTGWRLTLWAMLLIVTAGSHYYLAAIPFGIALWEVGERHSGWRGRALAAASALLLAVALVVVKAYASEVPTEKGYLRAFGAGEWWRLAFDWFPSGLALAPKHAAAEGLWGAGLARVLPFGWALLFALGVVIGWRRHRQALIWTLALGAAIPVGLWVLSAAGLSKAYIERSALPSMPFVYLVFALGLAGISERAGSAARLVLPVTGGVAVLILVAFFQRGSYWTVYKPNPDWREASAFLRDRLPAQGPPLRVYSDYISPTGLTYYEERIQEAKTFEFNSAKWQRAEERLGGLPLIGATLQAQVKTWREDWQSHIRAVEAQTRALVYELRFVPPDPESVQPIWLLLYGKPQAPAQALLADPRYERGQARTVTGLTWIELLPKR